MRGQILRLLVAISKALGLAFDYLNKIFGRHNQVMLRNYYPSCPNPDLTFGFPIHSHADGIIVLMQGDVSVQKILKNVN